jgi:hypothetical protein
VSHELISKIDEATTELNRLVTLEEELAGKMRGAKRLYAQKKNRLVLEATGALMDQGFRRPTRDQREAWVKMQTEQEYSKISELGVTLAAVKQRIRIQMQVLRAIEKHQRPTFVPPPRG